MKIRIDDSCFDLRKHQIMRFDGASGVDIVCLRGELWLTQDGDLRDVMLAAGDRFTLDRDGIALVAALKPSSVRVRVPVEPRATGERLQASVRMAISRWRVAGPTARTSAIRPH